MTHHPIRDATLNVWTDDLRHDAYRCIAMFGLGRGFPIWFNGSTPEEARSKAEAFRAETIDRNEANYIAKQEALAIARASRAKGKRVDEAEEEEIAE